MLLAYSLPESAMFATFLANIEQRRAGMHFAVWIGWGGCAGLN